MNSFLLECILSKTVSVKLVYTRHRYKITQIVYVHRQDNPFTDNLFTRIDKIKCLDV